MSKKLCKLVKDKFHKEDPEKFKKIVRDPKYFCKNCGRTAAKEGRLCKPEKL